MPNFRYKARDKYGKPVSGVLAGETKTHIAKKLRDMGSTPVSIEAVIELPGAKLFGYFGRAKLEDMNMLNRQMATLVKAGLPILSSLQTVAEQTENDELKKAIEAVMKDVESGNSFSESVEKYPHIFNELYVNMVRAAEATGTLDVILEKLAELGEAELETARRIQSAIRYPIIAFVTLCIGFLIVVTFVIPRFAALFAQFHTLLPLPTRILIAANFIVRKYWYLVLLTAGLIIFGIKKYIETNTGRRAWDNLKLKLPVFGPLWFKIIMSRFSRMTSIMLASGIPILEGLDMVSRTVGNVIVGGAIQDIRESVNRGSNISDPMKFSKMFSPMVVRMVAVGEDTGKLDDLLSKVSEYYDQQVEYTAANLTTLIEPILIFILGFLVLILALAIFLPMWNLIKLFRG